MSKLKVLFDGYSTMHEGKFMANCSCTLITGKHNIIVDTMTPWDGERILSGLGSIHADDIHFCIGTHGHPDHIGNLNLFRKATHIVGFSIYKGEEFFEQPFSDDKPYVIDEYVSVIPTPGHTADDVTVLVKTEDLGTVAVTGDLFEKLEDIWDATIWRDLGGSINPKLQSKSRNKIIQLADYIVPGHGPMFKVSIDMKLAVRNYIDDMLDNSERIAKNDEN